VPCAALCPRAVAATGAVTSMHNAQVELDALMRREVVMDRMLEKDCSLAAYARHNLPRSTYLDHQVRP
jgi:hypothetical protein